MSTGHGLVVGEPFFVIQFFDREGYHSSCVAPTEVVARQKAELRNYKGFVAATVPFPGTWNAGIPDVSMPADYKEALSSIDRPNEES